MTKDYRIDYTVTAYGRSRSAIKTFKAYCWEHAVKKLREHASKKWVDAPSIVVNGASIDGELVSPDLLGAI